MNYTKWTFILGIPIAFVTLMVAIITDQELRCGALAKLELRSNACDISLKVVEFITKTKEGEALADVKSRLFLMVLL